MHWLWWCWGQLKVRRPRNSGGSPRPARREAVRAVCTGGQWTTRSQATSLRCVTLWRTRPVRAVDTLAMLTQRMHKAMALAACTARCFRRFSQRSSLGGTLRTSSVSPRQCCPPRVVAHSLSCHGRAARWQQMGRPRRAAAQHDTVLRLQRACLGHRWGCQGHAVLGDQRHNATLGCNRSRHRPQRQEEEEEMI